MRTALIVVVSALAMSGAWVGRDVPASLAQDAARLSQRRPLS